MLVIVILHVRSVSALCVCVCVCVRWGVCVHEIVCIPRLSQLCGYLVGQKVSYKMREIRMKSKFFISQIVTFHFL